MKYFFVTFFVFASFALSKTFLFCQTQPPTMPTSGETLPTIEPATYTEEGSTTPNEQNTTTIPTIPSIPTIDAAVYKADERLSFVNEALKYQGTPYKYASTNASGMDCSGLVYRAALDALGKTLPRSSKSLADYCKRLNSNQEPEVGDLLFFNTTGSGISHVGIYIGDKKFVHAASSGPKTGVIVSSMTEKYYINCFLFYATFF